jgi:hypothetical protein
MSVEAIFLVGIIIFAITVYGVVMAGGMALTRVMVSQQPQQQPAAEERPPALTIAAERVDGQ